MSENETDSDEKMQPELFFSSGNYDSRQAEQYEREEGLDAVAVKIGKRIFAARTMAEHVIFRDVEEEDERAAWFIAQPYVANESDPRYFNRQWFVQQWKQGGFGRCVIFVAPYMTQWQCAHILFRPDGTGLAVDTHENLLCEFQWQENSPFTWPELLAADPDDLQPLCKTIFESQVNTRLVNAYLAPLGITPEDFADVPPRFECGSEQELRRLTIAILHSHPDLFADGAKAITIKYRARTANKRAFMALIDRYDEEPVPHLGRLQSLCDLALRLNTFVGETWSHWMDTPTRKGDFDKQMHKIFVEAQPPSAHERAESLLLLNDWLMDKVRPEKRLRLLGLDAEQ